MALVQRKRAGRLCWRPEPGEVAYGQAGSLEELFAGRHFDRDGIIRCVRWYLRFKLSLRDLVEMMAERGLSLAHTTIMRWVRHYTPEFEKRWRCYALAVGRPWRVDETYVKIRRVVLSCMGLSSIGRSHCACCQQQSDIALKRVV